MDVKEIFNFEELISLRRFHYCCLNTHVNLILLAKNAKIIMYLPYNEEIVFIKKNVVNTLSNISVFVFHFKLSTKWK